MAVNGHTLRAFLIAPLAGHLALAFVVVLTGSRGSFAEAPLWALVFYLPVLMIPAFATTWVVGFPAFLLLRRLGRLDALSFASVLAVADAAVALTLGWRVAVREGFEAYVRLTAMSGLAGAVTGVTVINLLNSAPTRAEEPSVLQRVVGALLVAPLAGAVMSWLAISPIDRISLIWLP